MKTILALFCALLLLASSAGAEVAAPPPVLSVGATGAEVIKLQTRLLEAGFLTGAVDGKYGEGTKKAVRAAQAALKEKGHQLAVDGIAGQQTLGLLYDDEAMAPFVDFTLGATGQRVITLQNRLIDLKFLAGGADGHFGQQTLAALKAFQQHLREKGAQDIQDNGLADAATRQYLKPDADLSRFLIQAPEFFDDKNPMALTDAFLNAKGAIAVNARNGSVLYAKAPEERLYPASTTKMMTLLLALEHGKLEEMHVLPEVAGKVPRDSSLVPVYPGEKMRLIDLLYGLMLRSGNDAASAIAEIVAGSQEAFVKRMNQRAKELGMKDTHFMNPHGYHDANHYSTAKDLAILALYAMNNRQFMEVAAALTYDLPATGKRGVLSIQDSSELLNPASPHYYESAFGIKSGYTSAAGFCYVGAARKDGELLVVAILGSRTRNRGWDDMARLFNYGFGKILENHKK